MPRPNVKWGRTTKTPVDQRCSLYFRTKELLHEDPRSLELIAREADLPITFLLNFSSDRSASPNIHRVQKLYEFLAGKKLELV